MDKPIDAGPQKSANFLDRWWSNPAWYGGRTGWFSPWGSVLEAQDERERQSALKRLMESKQPNTNSVANSIYDQFGKKIDRRTQEANKVISET